MTTVEDSRRADVFRMLDAPTPIPVREIATRTGIAESTIRGMVKSHEVTPVIEIPVAEIILDPACQPRERIDDDAVQRYTEGYVANDPIPPVVVFQTPEGKLLVDGWHRHVATLSLGWPTIPSRVMTGTRTEAIKYAAGVNAAHGLPRTPEDKRRAVLTVLSLDGMDQESDSAIATICRVSPPFVASLRQRNGHAPSPKARKPDRNVSTGSDQHVSTEKPKTKPAPDREPGSDDDEGEPAPDPDAAFLATLTIRPKLSEACRATFDRDALAHHKALSWLAEGKRLGLASGGKAGTPMGAWEHQASKFLRLAYPNAWILCSECKGQGGECKACNHRGYVVP